MGRHMHYAMGIILEFDYCRQYPITRWWDGVTWMALWPDFDHVSPNLEDVC